MIESVQEIFEGAAAKYLSAVDADHSKSNQHEIGGLPSVGFKAFLGTPSGGGEYRYECLMAYIDDENEPTIYSDVVTWYDTRRHQAKRSPEYRLYYKDNPVTELIQPEDFCLIGKKCDGTLILFFTPSGSTIEYQLRYLFGVENIGESFTSAGMPRQTLIFPIKLLLDELGILTFDESSVQDDLDILLDRFPDKLPKTSEFSAIARELSEFDCMQDPDASLIGWMEREEALFRAYERHVVADKLRAGFGPDRDDVDEFIAFSLSVQNRRKSRVGHAFENHLGVIFTAHNLPFEKGGGKRYTENKSKPDFLFPSFEAYHNSDVPDGCIFLLGAKTTCKDRWRQVLSEGDRLDRKYLITLEAGISSFQVSEMQAKNLQLILPRSVHSSFNIGQQKWLYSVSDFIRKVKAASDGY